MKKRAVILITGVLIFGSIIGIMIGVLRYRDNVFGGLEAENIKSIVLYRNNNGVELKKDDIYRFVNTVKGMKLRKAFLDEKDGYLFSIQICFLNGNTSKLVYGPGQVVAYDDVLYVSQTDYKEFFFDLYNGH